MVVLIVLLDSLLGAAVADAASRPLHWVYDMTLMEELMKVFNMIDIVMMMIVMIMMMSLRPPETC